MEFLVVESSSSAKGEPDTYTVVGEAQAQRYVDDGRWETRDSILDASEEVAVAAAAAATTAAAATAAVPATVARASRKRLRSTSAADDKSQQADDKSQHASCFGQCSVCHEEDKCLEKFNCQCNLPNTCEPCASQWQAKKPPRAGDCPICKVRDPKRKTQPNWRQA